MLKKLLMGEIILNNGKYVDKIIDILWLIMEETSWVIPAHNFSKSGRRKPVKPPLPEAYAGFVTYIDLFSAETAALVAFTYYYLKEKFEAAVPEILNDRIKFMLRQRIITPFLSFDNMFWMGYEEKKPNNWNPWIISNILITVALTEGDISTRKRVLHRSMECLDFFIDGYAPDGGCDEGPTYWKAAGASFFDCLELIYDMTGGKADYFSKPIIYNMCDYIRKVHLVENYFTAFADCATELFKDGLVVGIRMGIRTNNPVLSDFSASLADCYECITDHARIYRNYKNIVFKLPKAKPFYDLEFDYLENLELAVIRNKNGYLTGAKGGHNAESHNHNDIGNVVVFTQNKPLLIDIGAPVYTKDTFGDKRYTVFPTNSTWHNLPIINGYGQKEGAAFTSDSFSASKDCIKIEYQSAYEAEANVKKALREITVTDEGVCINENVVYEGNSIQFNYYLCEKPDFDNNIFTFANGSKITVSDNLNCSLEAVELKDEPIRQRWNADFLYRICIKSDKDGEINFKLKIE